MKKLHVVAAGLGWRTLERSLMTKIAGLSFSSKRSCFPAVTCVAQASLRTGLEPDEHGIVFNGIWSDELKKPFFWEQSAFAVKGRRVWDDAVLAGEKIGLFFFQQSLGENADVILSPAPVHKHSGGMVMSVYTKPFRMEEVLRRLCGSFPLWRYWGPMSSPKIGRKIISYFKEMTDIHDVDEAYLYLPTLDYAAQKYGPESSAAKAALGEFARQIETLAGICSVRACELSVEGDYEITAVTKAPVLPNVILRKGKFFNVRSVRGRCYPDFYSSTAFAICDHEICVVQGTEKESAVKTLLATGFFEDSVSEVCGKLILVAARGSWCGYEWWTDMREAPDYASHVDIHNKPGFDPKELFFFNKGSVMGTHGRLCEVAYA